MFAQVDTRASPPRAIWVHPYEDEQYLDEYPEVKAKKDMLHDDDAPPSYDAATGSHASGSGEKSGPPPRPSSDLPDSDCDAGPHSEHKRGVFGRLRDKAIGTKEEREEHRRIRAEQAARAEEEARQARTRQLAEREAYMRACGGYAPYSPSYAARGLGGDNTGALLLGGLAGGLLLGDILGGGF